MKSKKATKRALLSSALSLVLCFSMLLGTTFAWFTDEASTAVNAIQSGTLEVVLEYWDGDSWENAEGETLDFIKDADAPEKEEILWEPGCTYELPAIRVRNDGNLWLKYEIAITGINGDAELNEAIEWTYTYGDDTVTEFKDELAPGKDAQMQKTNNSDAISEEIVISGHMKEDAGNEYQNLKIDGIAITVFATQKDAEFDSFNNQYDVNATIGTPIYTTEEFYTALAEGTGAVCLNLMSNDVVWTTGAGIGSTPLVAADSKITSLTINGNGKTLTFDGSGVGSVRAANGAKVTFNNVNVVDQSVSYAEDAWEFTYLEFAGVLEFNDCTFNSGIQLQTEGEESVLNATFTDCEFITNESSVYAVWVSDGVSTFENCSFIGTRGLKVHEAYGSEVASVVVDNCVFDLTSKPGVAIGTVNADTSISITNSLFDCQPGDQDLYIYETDTDVNTFTFVESNNRVGAVEIVAPGVVETATKTYEVASAQGMANLNDVLETVVSSEGQGTTINLKADVDLAGQAWEPINEMWVTFNGNDHTIKNMTVEETRKAGLFGYAGAVTINDLTIENANVTGSQAGIFAGAGEGLTVNNCYLKGTNTVTFAATEETWNGIGAITGVLTTSKVNVEIVEGATVTLNKGTMTTDPSCTYVDNLTGYIQANNGTVTNNGKVTVNAAASDNAALDAAIEGGADVVVLGSGEYIIPDSAQGKTLTIVGSGDAKVAVTKVGTGGENCDYGLDGSTVVFENITITTNSSTYIGYARCNATYNNCTINGTYTLYGDSVFNNCTFNVTGDVYNIWTWGAPTATFNNCTFNSDGKAILLYGTANTKLTVDGCTFNDNGGLTDLKAAIEIGDDYGKSYELIVNNTTVNGYEINDKGISTGTTLWANKNSMGTDKLNVVIDGVDVY